MPHKRKQINNNYFAVTTLVEEVIKEQAEKVLATKSDLKYLPTKTEFYNSMDKIMNELATMREESTVSTDIKRQVNEHEERLETIESKLGVQVAAD